jgi:DNA polymerase III epsilon subunit-like protein
MSAYIEEILKVLNGADIVAGHNIEYDENILSYELERL